MNKSKDNRIYARDGKTVGYFTGGTRPCTMEGCHGERLGVRWKDGTLTFPCSRGTKSRRDSVLQIV
jgi:hypothetical protein